MELLAPAGGMESVVAAVLNGTDAVYFGAKQFNARKHADNFDTPAFKQAVDYCHLRGVKVYQTLNTLLYDDELHPLSEVLQQACDAHVDALIVQDFGVIATAKQLCPTMPLHGSTQMTVHSVAGAQFCKDLGLDRVVLARELTLDEIKQIATQVDIELEVFGHGALCMSVSGQCYMSAMIGTRSGNRGSCAGSCRLPFGCQNPTDYDLSLKDLSSADQIASLQALGVASLKIEGRMKRPEYVASAVASYRAILQNKPVDLTPLEAVFSRNGFTDGYLAGKIDGEMFGTRGKDDVLSATERVLSDLRQTYHKERGIIPVTMAFTLCADAPATLTLSDGTHAVTATGDLANVAINRPTSVESAQESLGKLGGTPFALTHFDATIADGLMLPKSALNSLRRDAVDALSAKRVARATHSFSDVTMEKPPACPQISRKIGRFHRLEQVDFALWDRVILPIDEVMAHKAQLQAHRDKLIIEPDRLQFVGEARLIQQLTDLKQAGFSHLACQNPAHLGLGRDLQYTLFGMPFLNCTNSQSAQFLADLGLDQLILSFEMTAVQSNRVTAPLPLGNVVYGRLPLMIVRNCPAKRHGGCGECDGKPTLTDRLGNQFPVRCRNKRFAEVFNCKTLWMSDRQNELRPLGLYYFTEESRDEIAEILKSYQQKSAPTGEFTRGLYYRKTT